MKKTIYFCSITGLFLTFFTLHFSNLLPDSLVTNSLASKSNLLQQLSPQGFGFYSKSPTEEDVSFESEHLKLPNAIPSNFFGLSRHGRAQAVELGKLYEKITDEYFVECEYEEECRKMTKDITPFVIKKSNKEMSQLPKGEYLVKIQKPISWYFKSYRDTTSFNRRVAKVVIR